MAVRCLAGARVRVLASAAASTSPRLRRRAAREELWMRTLILAAVCLLVSTAAGAQILRDDRVSLGCLQIADKIGQPDESGFRRHGRPRPSDVGGHY